MSSRKRNSLIMLIIVAVLAVAIIISLVLLILQRTGLEKITINPTFADTELDVNMDYIISVNTDPSGAKIEKFNYESDSSSVTFEYKSDGTAVLHTTGEGAVTVYVKKGKVESNKLTFQIVDKAAAMAAEQAAAAAQAEQERLEAEAAQAEQEAAEPQVTYIKCIKDNVNIRSNGSTDGDVLGKAKLGDTFELINDNGEWTEFKYGEQSGFMRNDMIAVVSEGEEITETAPAETKTEEPKQEEKKEEKKEEETKKEKTPEEIAAEEAKKAEEAQKAAEEAAQKAAEEAAAQAAALAAQQAATAATGALPASGAWIYQGKTFSAKQVAYFHAKWDYTGDAAEMVTHHSADELQKAWEFDHPGETP